MKQLRATLLELGLSSYKADTYLALMRIGTGTIQQIAKISNVPACKLYENLRWLHERGYISLVLQKPLTYHINDPKTFLQSELSARREGLDAIERQLSSLVPVIADQEREIIAITNTRQAFFAKMKESIEQTTSSISYLAKSWKLDASLLRSMKAKTQRGVVIRSLGPMTAASKDAVKMLSGIGVKVRHYDPGNTRFSVFDRNLVIIRLRQDENSYYSVWLRSDVLASILEDYFNMLWRDATRR